MYISGKDPGPGGMRIAETTADGRAGRWNGGALDDPRLVELRRRLSDTVGRVCPPWLAAEREDIVQTALIKVVAMLDRGEGNRDFGPSYLWKVGYTQTMDEIRRRRRMDESPLDGEAHERVLEAPGDPEREASSRQLGEAIAGCLKTLVPPRRVAVALRLQGHSVPEAAGLLRFSEKRTENLVYRGLSDFRRCLEGKGFAP